MGLYLIAAGGVVLALLGVAMLVAGWEFLLEREAQHRLRRDRDTFAASSPLPLAESGSDAGARQAAWAGALAGMAGATGSAPRRDASWIDTRPTVLSCAPAVDDETLPRRYEEVDLPL